MIVTVAVAVLLWVAVLARVRTVRRDAHQRMLWANLVFGALAVTLGLPALLAGREGPVAAQLCGVVAAHLLLRFLSLVTGTGRAAAQWAVAAAVLVFMAVVATPGGVAYWVVFGGYLSVALLLGARTCAGIGRAAPAGPLRTGLFTMAAGLLLIAGYATGKVILVVAHSRGSTAAGGSIEPWLVALRGAGVLLYVAGASVPAAARLRTVLTAYRTLMVLRPLWSAMRAAFPEMVLVAPARAALEMTGEAGVRLRVYRRVIEIRDGMLALREYLPAPPSQTQPSQVQPAQIQPTQARPPRREADPAVAEARAIAVALRRRAAGKPPADPPGRWAQVGPDMADEVAWLSQVSRAFSAEGARTPRPAGSPR